MIMVDTRIYKVTDLDKNDVQADIKNIVRSGKNIIFPTETVYGIGASALSEKGVQNIYKVKGRPSDNPLIMHFSDIGSIHDYIHIDQSYVKKLIEAFWPGPLTMVFRRKPVVPNTITGGLDTVAIRVPSHPIAQKVIAIAGVPVCAPSANISGTPSSTLFEHVYADFNKKVDIIIDGGKSDVGLESTVLDVTGDVPVILRPGIITKAMIKSITPHVDMSEALQGTEVPKSPGMKYKHYAPVGKLTIVEGEEEKVTDYINDQIKKQHQSNKKVGVIATANLAKRFDTDYVFNIGESFDEAIIASNLYIALRTMDQMQIDVIYSVSFHQGRYGEVIMNRLYKAANHRVVKV